MWKTSIIDVRLGSKYVSALEKFFKYILGQSIAILPETQKLSLSSDKWVSLYWKVKLYSYALFGDLNYKFKAFCANLRRKFKAFLTQHSCTNLDLTPVSKFCFVKTIEAK